MMQKFESAAALYHLTRGYDTVASTPRLHSSMTIFSAAIEIMRDLGFPNGLPEIVIGYARTMEDRFDELLRIHGGSNIAIASNLPGKTMSLEINLMGDGWICLTYGSPFGHYMSRYSSIVGTLRHLMCGTLAGTFANRQKSPEIYKNIKHLVNQLRMMLLNA